MLFADAFPFSFQGKKIDHAASEALAELSSQEEHSLKTQALAAFLSSFSLPEPEPLVCAPLSRFYRTTAKRRISCRGNRIFFHFGRIPGKEPVTPSVLEPRENMKIYAIVREMLSQPRAAAAAKAANYCIIRGSGRDRSLILNVRALSGEIVRTMRLIAEKVHQEIPEIRSAFLYVDETGSDYYLEAERPAGKMGWKKCFGPEQISLSLPPPLSRKFLYPVTVFSQINESILPLVWQELERRLAFRPADQLLDLYCGYGLWSLLAASCVRTVWGAELSPEAVAAARKNAAYHFPEKNLRYEAAPITASFLRAHAPAPAGEKEVILLDPPRHGTAPGVLETLISRRPRRIAHLFCGMDELPEALKIYRANNCRIEALIPLDFFPGTINVEMLALIVPPGGSPAASHAAAGRLDN